MIFGEMDCAKKQVSGNSTILNYHTNFKTTNMNKGFKYWLNWILVLPISLISAILITFPVHWLLYRILSGGETPFITPYPVLLETILQPFFSALVFVWVSYLIAPHHKFKTAIILSSIWVLTAGGAFILSYLGYNFNKAHLNLTAGGLPIIMGIVGAIVGLYIIKKNLNQKLSITNQ